VNDWMVGSGNKPVLGLLQAGQLTPVSNSLPDLVTYFPDLSQLLVATTRGS
jgi:hypothetical protein